MASVHRTIPPLSEQDIERFWFYVGPITDDGCWLWWGYCGKQDYGIFQLGGQPFKAHRVAFLVLNDEQPGERVICHKCNNPRCVNPAHLYAGTPAENAQDAIRAGTLYRAFGDEHWTHKHPERIARGERGGGAKLTADDIRAIRTAHDSGSIGKRELGELYGVSRKNISQIVNRRTWSHVE